MTETDSKEGRCDSKSRDETVQHGHLGILQVPRITGAGTDDDEVVAFEVAIGVHIVSDDVGRHAEHTEDVGQHVDEVVLTVDDHDALAGQRRHGCRAGLVGEPELAQPLVAGAQRDQHLVLAGEGVEALDRLGRRLHEPERAEDAGGLGPRLLGLVHRIGVTYEGRAGGDLEVAVEVDVGRTDEDRRVGERVCRRRHGRSARRPRRSSPDPPARTP